MVNNMNGIFITGTDTGIGKTWFTLACIDALQQAAIKTVAMKPVASGAEPIDGQLRNEDALLIQQRLNDPVDYSLINPYCFAEPVSPHIAAARAGVAIDLQHIQQVYARLTLGAEFVIVEGVGGWLAPLSDESNVADLADVLGLPVVMVVGMRLGCLNHARLTARAIEQSGLKLAGWVANCIEPELLALETQIDYLTKALGTAPLARTGWQQAQPIDYQAIMTLFE